MSPIAERPAIPAGYGVSTDRAGMLDWSRVAQSIAGAEIYWLATVAPDGGPHLVPLHATAVEEEVFLSGDEASRWSRNLADDPRIQIGIEHAELQVMVRGSAGLETPAGERFERVNSSLQDKYGFSFEEPPPMWVVAPQAVIAFDTADFVGSPTRFRFGATS